MRLIALLLWAGAGCFAQAISAVSLSNGVRVEIAVSSSNPAAQPLQIELAPAGGNSFYRIFRDHSGLAVFAYSLTVNRTADGQRFVIVASPAGDDFAAVYPYVDGGKPTPTLSQKQEFPALQSGEHATVEILTDLASGSHITDVISATVRGPATVAAAKSGALPQLRFSGVKVYINRTLATPRQSNFVVTGRFAMIYLPERGGYFLAPSAPESKGFVPAGSIDGARLTFTLDNESFECVANAPFLTRDGRGEIWVYHDPAYKPGGNLAATLPAGNSRSDEFFAAASDSLHWWLR